MNKPPTSLSIQVFTFTSAELLLISARQRKCDLEENVVGHSFASLTNNISNCSVSKVRTKCILSAKCSCSTKWTLIWFFCRVRVHSLFSWWINNATMRILPFSEKGRICLFSDIHDPKGIRHQRPVNEKAFSGLQSLRSRIHLNQLGAKSFWHQVILQGETDNDH